MYARALVAHDRGRLRNSLLVCVLLTSLPVYAQLAPSASPSRGELLYTTHCISCHTTQMHWRTQTGDRLSLVSPPSSR